jgi:hypothetical protein
MNFAISWEVFSKVLPFLTSVILERLMLTSLDIIILLRIRNIPANNSLGWAGIAYPREIANEFPILWQANQLGLPKHASSTIFTELIEFISDDMQKHTIKKTNRLSELSETISNGIITSGESNPKGAIPSFAALQLLKLGFPTAKLYRAPKLTTEIGV